MDDDGYMNEEVSQEEVNDYLDALRDSGITNMYGARPYLMDEFQICKEQAGKMLQVWMNTYSERHPTA